MFNEIGDYARSTLSVFSYYTKYVQSLFMLCINDWYTVSVFQTAEKQKHFIVVSFGFCPPMVALIYRKNFSHYITPPPTTGRDILKFINIQQGPEGNGYVSL